MDSIRTDRLACSHSRKGSLKHRNGRSARAPCLAPPRKKGSRGARLALDGQATEAINHFAWLLARCGFSREEAARSFRAACTAIPPRVGAQGAGSGCTPDEASHVITLWYMTSGYLDGRGRPLPLALRGPAPSLEALVHQVNQGLTLESVLNYFSAGNALTRRGNKYLPTGRAVRLRPGTSFQSTHNLRVVSGLLRTVELNTRGNPQCFEYCADGMIPESKLRSTRRDFYPIGMEMLQYADAFMLRRSKSTKGKGKHVPLTVGVYIFEGRPLPAMTTLHRGARSQHRKRLPTDQSTTARSVAKTAAKKPQMRRRDSRAAPAP